MSIKKIILYVIVIFCLPFHLRNAAEHIAVIGTGYVGLITGVCFAEFGHTVICADTDGQKINLLNHQIIPIYEPGLHELVAKNTQRGNISFTTDIDQAIDKSDYIFIAVGTPMCADGCADLTAVYTVFDMIVPHLKRYKIICVKSTVPIGTGDQLLQYLQKQQCDSRFYDLVSNPEFLREGSAIYDFMNPDRIVIGSNCQKAHEKIYHLYDPLIAKGVPCIRTNLTSSYKPGKA